MKFTKEEALEKIKKALGKTHNLSERTLTETIANTMPLIATDETEVDDYVTKVTPLLKTMDGNVKHSVTAQIDEYKKNNPTPTPTPPAPPANSDDMAKNIQEAVKAAMGEVNEKLQTATTALSAIQQEKAIEAKFTAAKALFAAKKPDPKRSKEQEKSLDIVKLSLKGDETPEQIVEAWDKEYNGLVGLSGGTPYVPEPSKPGVTDGNRWKDEVARLRNEGKIPEESKE